MLVDGEGNPFAQLQRRQVWHPKELNVPSLHGYMSDSPTGTLSPGRNDPVGRRLDPRAFTFGTCPAIAEAAQAKAVVDLRVQHRHQRLRVALVADHEKGTNRLGVDQFEHSGPEQRLALERREELLGHLRAIEEDPLQRKTKPA